MAQQHRPTSLWDYFTRTGKARYATCNQCCKLLSYRTSITNLKSHLKFKHKSHYTSMLAKASSLVQDVYLSSPKLSPPRSSTSAHEENEEESQGPFTTARTVTPRNILSYTKSLRGDERKNTDAMLLKLIAKTYQPYSIVEDEDFVEFVQSLNPNYVLPARKVISETLIPFLYNQCLDDQKNLILQEAVTVCLTTDCWTSIKMSSFIGITAHFINNEFQFKSVLLKCSEVNGLHTSQNLASILSQTIAEWELTDKINLCVTDNAANIVAAINSLGWRHCGCMAHELNLSLQHSLRLCDDILKKVKKIVIHHRSSHKAEEKLLKYQKKVLGSTQPLALINSVPTRWDSTYSMIERFVNLKDYIRANVMMPNLDVDLPILTGEEWTALGQLYKVLRPFNEATKELSAEKYVCASKAVAVINGLKDVLEELKKKPESYDAIKNVVEGIESQLDVRFRDLEYEDYLAMCTILDPRYKTSMFINEDAVESAKTNLVSEVLKLIIEEFTDRELTNLSTEESQSNSMDEDEVCLWRKRNLILEKKRVDPKRNFQTLAQEEIESYMQDEFAQSSCDPCQWWRSGQYKYPHLAKLYKNKCNLVATSVPSERLFSKAGDTLSERRTRLSVKKTQQLVFLNANLKNCDMKKLMP